ncbi:hypothetical protein GN958_ATG05331 [Phytophthora infestans]|uniref:Uncharacterized protein n=1 Tax=Phytophthora infestans TaxID=4787 RepID=A0A8S9V4V0_PHYIN|nr:hypothetical protein GN958_ATG05331 [Phytophthora infestans]
MMVEVSTLLRQQQNPTDKLVSRPAPEKRAEGIAMPKYSGSLDESLELFLDQMIMRMKDVSEIDKIAIFTWGRCLERAQMIYHRYSIAHDAISVSKTVKTFHHGTFPAKHVAAKSLVNHIMILAIVKQNNCLTVADRTLLLQQLEPQQR